MSIFQRFIIFLCHECTIYYFLPHFIVSPEIEDHEQIQDTVNKSHKVHGIRLYIQISLLLIYVLTLVLA